MNDTVEKLDQDIKLFDKQVEIDKNIFAYNILNGLGDVIKRELETPPPKHKIFMWKIKHLFYKLFNLF